MLAVLKAGGAYVPLDPSYPRDRLAFMLDDTRAPLVLTQSDLAGQLPAGVVAVPLDWIDPELAGAEAGPVDPVGDERDVAYVIYTSGSTGRPKGVVVRHAPVVNCLDWVAATFGVGPGDRVLFVTSLSFDLSVFDVFGVLGAGGSVRVADEEELRDPAKLLRVLRTEPITVWDSAPATLQQLVPYLASRKPADRVDRLKLVMLSGDWIPVPLPDQVRAAFPNARVRSLGGATEAAIWSNWYPVEKVDPAWPSIPYGRPIRNARYHVLNAKLQPQPVGVPGELHIGGPVLADGYLNRPELSAERFIADPFAPGGKLYKTGDLARYFPDGNIEFLGRIDHQVKVRGFRVELGEIEAGLAQHPAVQDAVVRPFRDAGGFVYLAAYVVRKPGQKVECEELSKHLATHLPEYMVPAHCTFLDRLPLTPNGKVDRNALQPPDVSRKQKERDYVAPDSHAERDLQAIWEEVLNVKPVSVADSFFDLGGHSLLAAVLMAKIEARTGHKLPLDALLASPTIRDLATRIQTSLELGGNVLVPFQTEGPHVPMVLIAGAGGHVFTYHKFARLLGNDYPTYGMKAVGADGSEEPADRIEDIAARYLKELTAARPDGPFVVSGYSSGALVALEMAIQLQRAGYEVPRLVVFDNLAPGYPKPLPAWRRAAIHAANFIRLPPSQKYAYLKARLWNVAKRVLRKLRVNWYAPPVAGVDVRPQQVFRSVWAALDRAKMKYWPSTVYKGTVVLISADEKLDWAATYFDDPKKGWEAWATDGVELHTVPTTHLALFNDENLDLLVTQVRGALRDVAEERAAAEPAAGRSCVAAS